MQIHTLVVSAIFLHLFQYVCMICMICNDDNVNVCGGDEDVDDKKDCLRDVRWKCETKQMCS